MKPCHVTAVLFLVGALAHASPSMAEQIYLYADFNDKTIDEPIGEGGAAVGEPAFISPGFTAPVRSGPMGSPSLEIQDQSSGGSGSVRFEFLDDAEVTTGMIYIAADLWFHEQSEGYEFFLYVREHESSAKSFANLGFYSDGTVELYDNQGALGTIGAYVIGQIYRVVLGFDMDAGTYDVWLEDELVVDDRAHGITDRGVGGALFGFGYDTDLNGYFNVDAILVTDYFQAVPVEEQSWGRIKSGYR